MNDAVHVLPGAARDFPIVKPLAALAAAIVDAGGTPIAVGGAVRDHLLGFTAKDIDVEVYGLSLAALEVALATVGNVHAVGRSFGVLKVDVGEAEERVSFDVSLPRTESKVGRGHRGFVVESDPSLSFDEASLRRDFTVNAIGVDLVSGALLDPHGGARDLAAGVLRHVSPAFDEDPLRVLRAAQLAARFMLRIDDETLQRCRALGPELESLARERIFEEMKKLLVRARFPSVGLSALVDTGAITLFPEIAAMRGVPQEPEWHPEGDVWVHTMMVVDEAAAIAQAEQLDEEETLIVTLAALCHDLGKPLTTDVSQGRITSKNHEAMGEGPTVAFLERMGAPPRLQDDVVPLVRDHLKPWQLYAKREEVSDGALRRLALRVSIPRLLRVARADHFGRTTPDALARDDPAGLWLRSEAQRLAVESARPEPVLLGRHLLARGHAPGPALGVLLKLAFEAQLDGAFTDVEGALRWLDARSEP
jgi:tRNA nucleotidyltransferase (CCA-adding enzyme)